MKEMKKRQSIVFKTEKQHHAGSLKRFSAILLAILIVGGSVSFLFFLKNYNFDLKAAFGDGREETQTVIQTVDTAEAGELNLDMLLYCSSSDDTALRFVCIMRTQVPENKVTMLALSPDSTATLNGTTATLSQFFKQGGAPRLIDAVEQQTSIRAHRYIGAYDEDFKSAINHFGGFTVNVESSVEYRGSDFTLILPSGKQSMRGDILHKYLRYLLTQGEDGVHRQAVVLLEAVEAMLASSRADKINSDYSYVANRLYTDISIVDFSSHSQIISTMMQGDITYISVSSPEYFED